MYILFLWARTLQNCNWVWLSIWRLLNEEVTQWLSDIYSAKYWFFCWGFFPRESCRISLIPGGWKVTGSANQHASLAFPFRTTLYSISSKFRHTFNLVKHRYTYFFYSQRSNNWRDKYYKCKCKREPINAVFLHIMWPQPLCPHFLCTNSCWKVTFEKLSRSCRAYSAREPNFNTRRRYHPDN